MRWRYGTALVVSLAALVAIGCGSGGSSSADGPGGAAGSEASAGGSGGGQAAAAGASGMAAGASGTKSAGGKGGAGGASGAPGGGAAGGHTGGASGGGAAAGGSSGAGKGGASAGGAGGVDAGGAGGAGGSAAGAGGGAGGTEGGAGGTDGGAGAPSGGAGGGTGKSATTISYAPNSFVIGNAYTGWTDKSDGTTQFSSGPGNPNGTTYQWGFLYGESFDRCAWINADNGVGVNFVAGSKCGSPQQIDTPYFHATYTNGTLNKLAGDGSLTHMNYAGSGCTDTTGYGNVLPWKVPAELHNSRGPVPDGAPLRWRYVSRDGNWVMVRDPAAGANPNWYFVNRGCISLANTH